MTAPLVTPSRDTLAEVLAQEWEVPLGLGHRSAAFDIPPYIAAHLASALLASGVVRAVDTLADDEALVERVRANVYATPRYYPTSTADILRALATALESR